MFKPAGERWLLESATWSLVPSAGGRADNNAEIFFLILTKSLFFLFLLKKKGGVFCFVLVDFAHKIDWLQRPWTLSIK